MLAIRGVLPTLIEEVNPAIFPEPLAAKFIPGLSFVQSKVTPGSAFEVNTTPGTGSPEQRTIDETTATTGVVLIVMVNVFAFAPVLTQLFFEAVTTIVPTKSAPVLFAGAVNTRSPEPLNAVPINGLEFVHVIAEAATLLVKGILTRSPGQKVLLVTVATSGSGLIVIVNVLAGPEQRFFVPVTEIVAEIGNPLIFVAPVKDAIFPVPEEPRLIAVLSFVQLNVTPADTTLEPKGRMLIA
jgi:hypothetical protein